MPTTLDDASRTKLDGIVQQMQTNKEPDANIQAVVDDFKTKYTTQQSAPSPTPKSAPTGVRPAPFGLTYTDQDNPSYFDQVKSAFQGGVNQANAASTAPNTSILQGAENALGVGSGVASAIASPAIPLFNATLGRLIQGAGQGYQTLPAVQQFAQSPASDPVRRVATDLSNAGNIAGTILGGRGILEKAPAVASTVRDTVSPPHPGTEELPTPVRNRVAELTKVEQNNAPVRNAIAKAKTQGIDSKALLAQTDLLHGTVDKSGTINTTQAMSDLNDFLAPQESVISDTLAREGAKIPLTQVESAMRKNIDRSGLEGAALDQAHGKVDAAISGLKRRTDAQGMISLSKVHDAKTSAYRTIDYMNEGAKIADKTIARSYKELVERHTNSADVKALNGELQQHYAVMNLLEKLNGKKAEGGRLGKYVAQTIGGLVGSHFGPLGTIAGAELGRALKGSQLARTFKGKTGATLEQSNTMQNALAKIKQPPLALPPRGYSPENATIRNTNQTTTIAPIKNAIPKRVTQPEKSASPLLTRKSAPSSKGSILKKAKAAFQQIKTQGKRGFIKLPDTSISTTPQAVAQKAGILDIFKIRDFLANHKDPGMAVRAETRIEPLLKQMGISKLNPATQKRFLGEVVTEFDQIQPRHPQTQRWLPKK